MFQDHLASLPQQVDRTGLRSHWHPSQWFRSIHFSDEITKMNAINNCYQQCGLQLSPVYQSDEANTYVCGILGIGPNKVTLDHRLTRKNLMHVGQRLRGVTAMNMSTSFSAISVELMMILKRYFVDISDRNVFKRPNKDRLIVVVENYDFLEHLAVMNLDYCSLKLFSQRVRLWRLLLVDANKPIGNDYCYKVFKAVYEKARQQLESLLVDYIVRGIQEKLREGLNTLRAYRQLMIAYMLSGDIMQIQADTFNIDGEVQGGRYQKLCQNTLSEINRLSQHCQDQVFALFNRLKPLLTQPNHQDQVTQAIAVYRQSVMQPLQTVRAQYQYVSQHAIMKQQGGQGSKLTREQAGLDPNGALVTLLGGNLLKDSGDDGSFSGSFLCKDRTESDKTLMQNLIRMHAYLITLTVCYQETYAYLCCAEEFGNSILPYIAEPVTQTLTILTSCVGDMHTCSTILKQRAPVSYDKHNHQGHQTELHTLHQQAFSQEQASVRSRLQALKQEITIQADLYKQQVTMVDLKQFFARIQNMTIDQKLSILGFSTDANDLDSYFRILAQEGQQQQQGLQNALNQVIAKAGKSLVETIDETIRELCLGI